MRGVRWKLTSHTGRHFCNFPPWRYCCCHAYRCIPQYHYHYHYHYTVCRWDNTKHDQCVTLLLTPFSGAPAPSQSPQTYTPSQPLVTSSTRHISERLCERREAQTDESLVYAYNVYVRIQYNYAYQNARWGPRLGNQRGVDEIALSHLRTNGARACHGRHICRKGTPSALLV